MATVLDQTITVPAQHEPVRLVHVPKISVVIPVYNEEKRIADSVGLIRMQLESAAVPYEIIIVDDGSTDATRSEALCIESNPHVKIAGHDCNQGITAAFKSGFALSSGEYVMLCPVDTASFSFLQDALEATEEYDIISVSKRHPKSVVIGYDKWRWLMSNTYHALVKILLHAPEGCTDTHYVKIYRRHVLEKVIPSCITDGAVGETEMIVRACRAGAKIVDIPGEIIHNQKNSKTRWKVVFRTVLDLARLSVDLTRTRVTGEGR